MHSKTMAIINDTPFPFADANGNCVSFIDNAGNVQAHYTYDAFGGTVSSGGDKDDDFRFRFSSKYLDDETGLLYYGYRYLSPALGRWLSRDPIAEGGGNNLFIMVNNNLLTKWDFLGKMWGQLNSGRDILTFDPNDFSEAINTFKEGFKRAFGECCGGEYFIPTPSLGCCNNQITELQPYWKVNGYPDVDSCRYANKKYPVDDPATGAMGDGRNYAIRNVGSFLFKLKDCLKKICPDDKESNNKKPWELIELPDEFLNKLREESFLFDENTPP